MSDQHGSGILPALLTGAAIYFGMNRKSGDLHDLTKEAVSRVIDHQSGNEAKPRHHQHRNNVHRRTKNKRNRPE